MVDYTRHYGDLEKEINEKAHKSMYEKFDAGHAQTHLSTLMTMATKLNSYYQMKSRPEKELAILFRRFSYNARILFADIPPTMQSQYAQKITCLKNQVAFSDRESAEIIKRLSSQTQQQPPSSGPLSYPMFD
jgi:hypothetical protein